MVTHRTRRKSPFVPATVTVCFHNFYERTYGKEECLQQPLFMFTILICSSQPHHWGSLPQALMPKGYWNRWQWREPECRTSWNWWQVVSLVLLWWVWRPRCRALISQPQKQLSTLGLRHMAFSETPAGRKTAHHKFWLHMFHKINLHLKSPNIDYTFNSTLFIEHLLQSKLSKHYRNSQTDPQQSTEAGKVSCPWPGPGSYGNPPADGQMGKGGGHERGGAAMHPPPFTLNSRAL